ncbi:AraC family transcriptional regulator [Chitinibacter sp. GC72]|uniref:helix-turn-helix transcriptional regulator n=1 Tax=Chitinibacter sp. GC72 TaxID=1526917 RepID=UPI0012FBCB89|nr:AraC family transcriptional regulator [Chitinibacter sp. GC72]
MGKREDVLDAANLRWHQQEHRYSVWHDKEAVMEGTIIEQELRPGLWLHGTEVDFHRKMSGGGQINPGLKLIIMLQGQVEARFDRRAVQLGGAQSNCVLLNIGQSALPYERVTTDTGLHRQLVLTFSPQWLAQSGLDNIADATDLQAWPHNTLASRSTAASPQMLALAAQLIAPEAKKQPLQQLERENQALSLLLAVLQGHTSPQRKLAPRARHRITQLLELLHADLAQEWSLSQLAQTLGSNPTTLQQQFRLVTGHSIASYIRRQRMEQACTQLRDGMSVTDAALNAGYNSPANFATAFKRLFGFNPSQIRKE